MDLVVRVSGFGPAVGSGQGGGGGGGGGGKGGTLILYKALFGLPFFWIFFFIFSLKPFISISFS